MRNISAAIEQAADMGDPLPPRMRLMFDMQHAAFGMARNAFNDERPTLEDRLTIICIICDPEYRRDPEKGALRVQRIVDGRPSNLAYKVHLEPYATALQRYWMDRELAPSDEAHDAMVARGEGAERAMGGASSDATAGGATSATGAGSDPKSPPATTQALTSNQKYEEAF